MGYTANVAKYDDAVKATLETAAAHLVKRTEDCVVGLRFLPPLRSGMVRDRNDGGGFLR